MGFIFKGCVGIEGYSVRSDIVFRLEVEKVWGCRGVGERVEGYR